MPGLEQPRSSFPDVALDKTGKINLDPSLMFRANVPETPLGYYWRIDVQNAFDGTTWRTFSSPLKSDGAATQKETPYTLEFVREWRDYRLPSIKGTRQIRDLSEDESSSIKFYSDSLGLWRRWGWKRGEPLMGYQFSLEDGSNEGSQSINDFIANFGELFSSIVKTNHIKNVPDEVFKPRHIWPNKRREPEAWGQLSKLAYEIVGDASSNREKADRVSNYLKTHYHYSLERPPREGNIVEDFLFRQQFGHCEVFSTTMAVLMAILDVPVHNVTGFVSSEFRDGYNYVRSAHAHSWVEVYVDGHWEIYDPTPSGAQQVEVGWLLRIDDWFASYQPQNLYRWITAHLTMFGLGAAMLLLLCLLSMFSIKWLRRRMLPTQEVWRQSWQELLQAEPESPLGQLISSHSLEDWWKKDCQESPQLQAFARNYIKNLYVNRDVPPLHGFAAFMENCRIRKDAGRLLRITKKRS